MNVTISLTDDLEEFVTTRVATGRNSSPSDVVSEALRLMEIYHQSDEEKLEWLREAYRIGIESGDGGPLDAELIKAEARARRDARTG